MARGQLAAYVCFDCGKATKAVQQVARDFYGDGSNSPTFVCRKGTGCHKHTDPYTNREIKP